MSLRLTVCLRGRSAEGPPGATLSRRIEFSDMLQG